MVNSEEANIKHKRRGRAIFKWLAGTALIAAFFGLGLAIGRGNLQVDGLSKPKPAVDTFDYSSVNGVYNALKKDFDGNLNKGQLLDGIKSGLVNAAGDPYTEYFNPKDAKDFNNQLSGSFTGIGAELGTDADGNIVIISPLSGYPAEKAGLKPKDIIAAVNGQSTSGQTVSSVVKKIRGPANTSITLTVIRGSGKPFDASITRTQIKVPSVKYSVEGSIGYLKISQFSNDTVGLVNQAASDFKAKGVKGIVLDLRGDPGGYLDGAVDVSSLWLPQGKTVVSERRGSTILSTKYSSGNDPFFNLPTVVLVDGGSASASEITAGALRDNGVATLVGEKTFGKGSVQQVVNFADGAELKVTVARWYTPGGKNIDKHGLTPDTVVEPSEADQKAGADPQKDKAYEILRAKL